jgi:ribosomal-protein-alanine N-acetyltransferase
MSAAAVTIEFATVGDAYRISALSHRYVEHGLRRRYTPAVIRQMLRNRSKNLVVARLDGALIGFGIMTYRRDSANLDLLAVRKPHRRRGVARQIVDWLEKVACTAGIANIFVQVRSSNSGAIRCYETLGYQAIAEIAGYYQGREAAVILCKGIRPMTAAQQTAGIRAAGRIVC